MITGSSGQEVTTTRRTITIKSSTAIKTSNGNGNGTGNGKHDRSSSSRGEKEVEVEVEIGVKSRPGATTWIPIQVITGVKIPWQVVGIPL